MKGEKWGVKTSCMALFPPATDIPWQALWPHSPWGWEDGKGVVSLPSKAAWAGSSGLDFVATFLAHSDLSLGASWWKVLTLFPWEDTILWLHFGCIKQETYKSDSRTFTFCLNNLNLCLSCDVTEVIKLTVLLTLDRVLESRKYSSGLFRYIFLLYQIFILHLSKVKKNIIPPKKWVRIFSRLTGCIVQSHP